MDSICALDCVSIDCQLCQCTGAIVTSVLMWCQLCAGVCHAFVCATCVCAHVLTCCTSGTTIF